MGWTKGELVDEAFGEIGLKSFNVNLDEEVLQSGLRRLDALMAFLDGKTIRLGYPIPSSAGGSRLSQDSGIPDYANEPIVAMLAVRIAPGFGKIVSPQTAATAKAGFNMLLGRATFPQQQQLPNTMPRGAGNKPWRYQSGDFMPNPVDPLLAGGDGPIEFN